MASSISQQLEDLLNPLPKFTDPEDDQDEATKAKVIEKFDEGDEEDGYTSFPGLKKRSTHILEETDQRYAGKATSRKELQKLLLAGSDEGEEEDEDEEDDDEGGDSDELDDDHEEEEEEDMEEEEEDDEGMDSDEDSPVKNKSSTRLKRDDASFPKVTDFHKLTEGMDDLGMSEEDEDGGSGEEDEDEDEESSEGEEEEDDEEVDDDDDVEEEDDAVMTFSKEKVDEEVEKGKCVKNQLALWDQLLEGRIKIQKALATANQLPQPQTFPEFKTKGGAQFSGALKNSHKALKALQRSLLDLQDLLLLQSTETRPIAQGKAWSADSKSKAMEDSDLDEEIESEEDEDEDGDEGEDKKGVRNGGPPKRKLEMSEYPDYMAKRFANFEPYRISTLQKWYDKTRLTMGKTTKGFGSFDRNILTQVEHVLMDKERLVRRTQTRRSQFRVLGKPESTAPVLEPATTEKEEVERAVLKANAHLKDLDEEIFDDSDFYHQLLRELIERKTSAADPNDQVAMGRQWLAIQKLRSKIKKKVDTKASKGRKIRFHIHSKLVNFMAPVDHSSMHDEARTELYRSLFGGNTLTGAPQHEGQ